MPTNEPHYWREKAAHLRRLEREFIDPVFIDLESVAAEYERRAEKAEVKTNEQRPSEKTP